MVSKGPNQIVLIDEVVKSRALDKGSEHGETPVLGRFLETMGPSHTTQAELVVLQRYSIRTTSPQQKPGSGPRGLCSGNLRPLLIAILC